MIALTRVPMKQRDTKGCENFRELCVLPPLLGERAGVRASVSSNPVFGVGGSLNFGFWIFDFGFKVGASLPRLLRVEKSFACDYGLRKRKKRPDWSRGAVISKRLLFVLTRSAAGCQFVESRLVMDSR